jgi:hypothetical protein
MSVEILGYNLYNIVNSYLDIIVSIEEIESSNRQEWIGYRIMTTYQMIELKIESAQNCCENYGIECWTQDIKQLLQLRSQFIKSHIESVGWCNSLLNDKYKELLANQENYYDRTFQFAAINVVTNAGVLQLVVYNEHNGYYPHLISVSWDNYTDEQNL